MYVSCTCMLVSHCRAIRLFTISLFESLGVGVHKNTHAGAALLRRCHQGRRHRSTVQVNYIGNMHISRLRTRSAPSNPGFATRPMLSITASDEGYLTRSPLVQGSGFGSLRIPHAAGYHHQGTGWQGKRFLMEFSEDC